MSNPSVKDLTRENLEYILSTFDWNTKPVLRDQFAMAALTSLADPKVVGEPDVIAKYVYEVADAMMAERIKVK